jgi:ribosomal protein S27AE
MPRHKKKKTYYKVRVCEDCDVATMEKNCIRCGKPSITADDYLENKWRKENEGKN